MGPGRTTAADLGWAAATRVGPPPPPINYFGFNEQPVWDPGYNQWGFWFFGIWIPLPI